MKRNSIYLVLWLSVMVIILSACGSNSKDDPLPPPTPTPTPIPTNGYAFINFPLEINITEYKRYPIDFQLIQEGLAQRDAEVTIKAFDKRYGSISSRYGSTQTTPEDSISSQYVITDQDGIGRFIYTPPALFPTDGTTFDLELVLLDAGLDDNNDTITVTQKITLQFKRNTNISNGRATTLSIVYGYKPPKGYIPPELSDGPDLGTGDRQEPAEWDGEGSKMINYYAVHAVDDDARRAIVGMEIKMSLINNIKELNGVKVQDKSGTIDNTSPIRFSDASVNFLDPVLYASQRVESRDNLIIVPSEAGVDSSYLGGWKINSVAQNTLDLEGNYLNLESTPDLSYIIGNERRLLGRNIAVADVEKIDIESITDEFGMAYFKVTFDPELAGHTVTLEAHGTDIDNNRIGISRIATLRWDDYSGGPVTTPNSGGVNTVPMTLSINAPSGAAYHLIDMEIVPSSFTVTPTPFCSLNIAQSDFHTNSGGQVVLAVNTDGNTSATGGEDICTIEWEGSAGSMYFEY